MIQVAPRFRRIRLSSQLSTKVDPEKRKAAREIITSRLPNF